MLVSNPITEVLYEHGYNGVDNIYEYWQDHKDGIKFFLERKYPSLVRNEDNLQDFELKVRWSSPIGVKLRFAIRKAIRETEPFDVIDLKHMKTKLGNSYYGLYEFSQLYPYPGLKPGMLDLRGITMMKYKYEQMKFENVDFSCATLDYSTFKQVEFHNCNMSNTSFHYGLLQEVTCDESTIWYRPNFSHGYIDIAFHQAIVEPKITYYQNRKLINKLFTKNSRYRGYTLVKGNSFSLFCMDKKMTDYISWLQRKLLM